MSPKVAIAGATGNIGPAVLKELLDAGFDVTVLTRGGKNESFGNAHVAEVDYNSLESLTSALTGQDVVVSTLGALPHAILLRLVDAAVAAQVQRFIPSEFGSDTTNERASKLPVYAHKIAVQKYLQEKAAASNGTFSYTLQINGPFFDWGLKTGFLFNLQGPVTELYDGGERVFSTTTLSGVGKGVVGIINNLEATKNRKVYIREAEVSQKQLLALSGKDLVTKVVSTEDLERDALAELQKPNANARATAPSFLRRAIFGEGFDSLFPAENLSNELLGVKTLTEDEIRGIVLKYAN